MQINHRQRRGATAIEGAFIYPLTFFIIFALMVGGMGVARYNEVSYVAREGARYASVHGDQYAQDNATFIKAGTSPQVTTDYIKNKVVFANATTLDTTQVSVTVTFNTVTSGGASNSYDWGNTWPPSPSHPPFTQATIGGQPASVTNTVSVTVTYQWYPEIFMVGPIPISSTSVMPMCY
jgi:Flp pilus assembly protein TadG